MILDCIHVYSLVWSMYGLHYYAPKVHFNFWNLWQKKENILNLNYFYSRQRSEQEERLVSTNKKQRQFVKANTGSESEKASLRIPKPACSVDRMEASSWQLSAEKQRHQEEGPHGRPCRHACQQSEGNVLHQTVKRVPLNNYLVGTLETDEDRKSLNFFFYYYYCWCLC